MTTRLTKREILEGYSCNTPTLYTKYLGHDLSGRDDEMKEIFGADDEDHAINVELYDELVEGIDPVVLLIKSGTTKETAKKFLSKISDHIDRDSSCIDEAREIAERVNRLKIWFKKISPQSEDRIVDELVSQIECIVENNGVIKRIVSKELFVGKDQPNSCSCFPITGPLPEDEQYNC